MAKQKTNADNIKEPSIVIRPLSRFGGLDNIHLALLVLVAILILFILVLSYSKQVVIRNVTQNCTAGSANASCNMPMHNQSQILADAKMVLASYSSVNSSLSILPYISNISTLDASYIPASKNWYVTFNAKNPAGGGAFTFSFLINDINTNTVTPMIQASIPSVISKNYVVTNGVIKMYGKNTCGPGATQLFWFMDPYAPGSIASLSNYTAIQNQFGSKVNVSLKMMNGQYTQNIGNQVGLSNAQALDKYLVCSSVQPKFNSFVNNLQSAYTNGYISPNSLAIVASNAGLNTSMLNNCMNQSTSVINAQGVLAQYYNVTYTPETVTDCQYMAIPQTTGKALCHANSTLC